MPSFPSQVGTVILLVEFESEILNMIDSFACSINNVPDDFFVTKTGARHDRIVDVGVNAIGRLRYRSHSALCAIGRATSNVVFGKDNDPCMG
jgi:hypothetical protein|tara:strand:- start:10759 stop:11034 length:276 start_codon:yes stop_codon:yes gene_type:complete